MARRSVAILSSSGARIGYTTYQEAQSDVDAGRAVRVSERCIRLIRLLPDPDGGGEYRSRRSGGITGPLVLQFVKKFVKKDARP